MKDSIKKILVENFVKKETKHFVDNGYEIDFEDIVRNGIKPAKDQDIGTLLIHSIDCQNCGAAAVNESTPEREIEQILLNNECDKCGEKIRV